MGGANGMQAVTHVITYDISIDSPSAGDGSSRGEKGEFCAAHGSLGRTQTRWSWVAGRRALSTTIGIRNRDQTIRRLSAVVLLSSCHWSRSVRAAYFPEQTIVNYQSARRNAE